MRRAPSSREPAEDVAAEQSSRPVILTPRAKSMPFARRLWGDQTLEQRMPSFLEAVMFEPEAEDPEHRSVNRSA